MEPERPAVGVTAVEATIDAAVDVPAESTPFAAFYGARRDRIVRAMSLTLGDRDLAADAVDEAMARAYQRWESVGAFADPGGWVYRVALNWATSVLRRRKRAPAPLADRDPTDVDAPAEPDLAAALAELPVHQRAVVVCRFYLGLSEQETAHALRTKVGTVKSRLHRALRHLETRVAHLAPKEHQ